MSSQLQENENVLSVTVPKIDDPERAASVAIGTVRIARIGKAERIYGTAIGGTLQKIILAIVQDTF